MILDWLEEWFKGVLIDGITSNLTGLFDTVNTKVGEIAADVGATPQGWNSGVFNMLRNLSETVIVPIAGAILALIMCYELIQLIAERNNMHDMDSWMLFRWVFKSAAAIILVSNTWNIVMAVFDITQSVVNQSAGVIIGNTSIDITSVVTDLDNRLSAMDIGGLLGLWFQSLFVGLTMNILSICIMLVVYGRMIEIYLVTSLGPIPLATIGNSEWRGMGQGYLKSLFALGFQAFLIMVVTGIYAVLVQSIALSADVSGAIWSCMGYGAGRGRGYARRRRAQGAGDARHPCRYPGKAGADRLHPAQGQAASSHPRRHQPGGGAAGGADLPGPDR